MQPTGAGKTDNRSSILQGKLDLMVLTTLEAMGPMHGYGIARRIEQLSDDALLINQGTIYLCLMRLVQKALDQREVGNVGKQSTGKVLRHYGRRT